MISMVEVMNEVNWLKNQICFKNFTRKKKFFKTYADDKLF